MESKPRIAWFATKEGGSISYLSDLLLPELSRRFEFTHFSKGEEESLPFEKAAFMHEKEPFDLFVYHLESSARSNPARIHLGLLPGAVVFHDFFLSTEGPEPIHASPWINTARRFNLGESWPSREVVYPGRAPRAQREVANALFPILLRERNKRDLEVTITPRLRDESEPSVLPFPVEVQETDEPLPGKVVFCGSPRIEFRAHKVLHACALLGDMCALHWVIDPSERREACALLEEFKNLSVTLIEGRSPRAWRESVKDACVAVHTCFSAFVHTSPYLEISASQGVPIVRSSGQEGELSSECGVVIPPGEGEALNLSHALEVLLKTPVRDRDTRAWVAAHLERGRVVKQWGDALHSFIEPSRRFLAQWRDFEADAKRELYREASALVSMDPLATPWANKVKESLLEF